MAEPQTRSSVFRREALEKISSPEQLTDYLHVTNPGIWAVLVAVILLLVGLLAWSYVGTLETTVGARATVEDSYAEIVANDTQVLESGMILRIHNQEYLIDFTYEDEYGFSVGVAQVDLPNGRYDCKVVVEQVHPIAFLFESR